jgi:tetratricopeptide (TPR) repeat protein
VGVFAAVAAVAADNLLDINSYMPATRIPLLFFAAFPVALSQRFYRLEGFPIQRRELDIRRWRIFLLPLLILVGGLAFQKTGDVFKRQGADLDLEKASRLTPLGKWDQALDLYDKALKLDPQNIPALYSRGSVYLDRNQRGDLEKALDDFNAVGHVMPDYKLVHYQKYETLLRLNREAEAKDELKRAVRLDPMLVYLLDDFKKARILAGSGQLEQALIIYQNLYFDYPTCVPMMIDYANCFAMAGNLPSAINLYQQTLAFDPGNLKALHNLQKVWDVLRRSKQMGNSKANVLGAELE